MPNEANSACNWHAMAGRNATFLHTGHGLSPQHITIRIARSLQHSIGRHQVRKWLASNAEGDGIRRAPVAARSGKSDWATPGGLVLEFKSRGQRQAVSCRRPEPAGPGTCFGEVWRRENLPL